MFLLSSFVIINRSEILNLIDFPQLRSEDFQTLAHTVYAKKSAIPQGGYVFLASVFTLHELRARFWKFNKKLKNTNLFLRLNDEVCIVFP